jgi:hypothetical protein
MDVGRSMTARTIRGPRNSRHLRIARPVSDIARSVRMYREGLEMTILDSFEDHEGYDGVMVGDAGGAFHLEFTRFRRHALQPAPTAEDLLVFYIASAPDWTATCARMVAAGFEPVASFNPYWERRAQTFRDHDGYRVVIHRGPWTAGCADG